MEFEQLNDEEKLDYLELLCWMSARANNLDCILDVPERTEDEILEHSSNNVLDCYENLLLSKLKKFDNNKIEEWFEEFCYHCGQNKDKVHNDERSSYDESVFICFECELAREEAEDSYRFYEDLIEE